MFFKNKSSDVFVHQHSDSALQSTAVQVKSKSSHVLCDNIVCINAMKA